MTRDNVYNAFEIERGTELDRKSQKGEDDTVNEFMLLHCTYAFYMNDRLMGDNAMIKRFGRGSMMMHKNDDLSKLDNLLAYDKSMRRNGLYYQQILEIAIIAKVRISENSRKIRILL